MKARLIMCFLICSCMVVGCKQKAKNTDDIRMVKVEKAESRSGKTIVSYAGRMRAVSDINVAFRVAGTIEKIPVKVGQKVKKGQVIAILDQRDYSTQFSATESEYAQIKADATRVMELFKRGSATDSENDKARYGLQQITAKYNAHKNALSDTRLLAPIDGYVQKIIFEPGETIAAGMPVVSLISGSKPEVEINITVSDFTRIDQVHSYTAIFDALPGKEFPLEVIGVTQKANLNQLYTLRLRINSNEQAIITPGMAVNVILKFSESMAGKQVVIPLKAVYSHEDKTLVWIYKDGLVRSCPVKVSEVIDNGRSIVEGINENDMIVVAGIHSLKEGERVRMMEQVAKSNIGGIK